MIKAPISLQDLRRSLYVKAKAESTWRFWGLYVHVCKMETLYEAYRMLERAIATTRNGRYTYVQYARFADDLVILIDSHPRHDWLVTAVNRRLREELDKLRVEINEDKSRMVDLWKG